MDFKLLVSTDVLSFSKQVNCMFTVKRVTLRMISSDGIEYFSISAK